VKNSVAIFDRTDEVIDIFPDEYFEYQSSSLFQEYVRDIKNGKIEFNRSILIHSGLPGCMGGDIGRDTIQLRYIIFF
jgi:hypothetical protein